MDVTNSQPSLLKSLQKLYPNTHFEESDQFRWDPDTSTIYYDKTSDDAWSLLHETGHMVSEHTIYKTDLELLVIEVQAWDAAKVVAKKLGFDIPKDHIEDCIDSYRDWLHARSTCTICSHNGIEQTQGSYTCVNCAHSWHVSHSRFCRVYRTKNKDQL